MKQEEARKKIEEYRRLIHRSTEDYVSDQMLRLPQPPLVKEAADGNAVLDLPSDFAALDLEKDLLKTLYRRRSNRVFTGGSVSLRELSFILWACQGVKGIRGKNYATLRTVPSGGARHPFETYVAVRNVDGLKTGLYHYLPMGHRLEVLGTGGDGLDRDIINALCGQKWGAKANFVLFWSIVPYRGEWRYSFDAHRVMMIDAGHVTQNVYVACSALGLGTCAIASVDEESGNSMFGLDGGEEFLFYAAPVGTVSEDNEAEEQAFYAFLRED